MAGEFLYRDTDEAENTLQGIKCILVRTDGDSVDVHFDHGIIVAARLGHITEIENLRFSNVELVEEMFNTKGFVHAGSSNVDRGSAADFVEEVREFGLAFGDDGLALFHIGVPVVFFGSTHGLAKSRKSDLRKAVFDDLVTRFEPVGFPEAEFFGGFF